jgi:hypothetical protein
MSTSVPSVGATRLLALLLMFAIMLWKFAYLAVGLRRFYLPDLKALWAWPLVVAAARSRCGPYELELSSNFLLLTSKFDLYCSSNSLK